VSGAPARGRVTLYWVALAALVLAGAALAVSARGFLASTHLLWLSAVCSVIALAAGVASIVWPASPSR
jgi:hypothetical protein